MNNLSNDSKIWIYQSSRAFSEEEVHKLKNELAAFANQWVSHNRALKAFSDVIFNRFIVLMVDETLAGASGCSIDSSVHFMKRIESDYQVSLFDRMTFAYQKNGELKTASRDAFANLFHNGAIDENTLVVDTLVKTKKQFDEAFLKPLKDSWHKRMV